MKPGTVQGLCRVAGISRQAYYRGQRQRQRLERDDDAVLAAVQRERRMQPRVGVRKLQRHLRHAGVRVGRDHLFALLGEHDLLVKPKRRTVRTTCHDPALPVFRNLLYEVMPKKPNEVWVSDVTFVHTHEGPVYLSLITDLVSRRIVGWEAAARNRACDSLKALRRAIADLPKECRPIHHSDRGSQYCAHDYVEVLQDRAMPISMTEQNHCYENCYAERVNGILKNEFNLDHTFRTRAQARTAIAQAIAIYNTYRLHSSLQLRTPDDAHYRAAA